jgi:hypothetical protein
MPHGEQIGDRAADGMPDQGDLTQPERVKEPGDVIAQERQGVPAGQPLRPWPRRSTA